MISIKDIAWVAGLLEGEGCFYIQENTPVIVIDMTDLDIVEKWKSISKGEQKIHTRVYPPEKQPRKPAYSFQIRGTLAIQWIMTIYPLMGLRRKAKIREILHHWKNLRPSMSKSGNGPRQHSSILRILKKIHGKEEGERKYLELLHEGLN